MKIPLPKMKKRTIDAIRSFALLAGLFVFPMTAKAVDFAPFTASSEMLTINGTAQTSAVAYYVGIGFNHDTMAISNGGSLTLTGAGYAGALSMGNGTLDIGNSVTVDGAGSRWPTTPRSAARARSLREHLLYRAEPESPPATPARECWAPQRRLGLAAEAMFGK